MTYPCPLRPARRSSAFHLLVLTALTAFIALSTRASAALPAFPGAEGFGANATGGRGGSVYVVTNLNDSGPGSFRDAVSQPNRYVVFAVGGVIKIMSRIAVRNNITIAGQTAPGEGITIYGNGISFSNASNTICRYIRFRQGINGDGGTDAVGIASGDSMIFDHVSASWGRDETFSVSGTPSNITLQDCIVGQGLLAHSAGGLMQTDGGVSVFRTLYTDNWMRNPKVKGVHEFTNNIVYNWGGGGGYILGDSAGQSYANISNNYFIAGPNSPAQAFTRGNLNFHVFADNNFHDANRNGVLDGTLVPPADYTTVDFVGTRFPYPAVTTLLTPEQAYAHVVAHAGASLHRDSVDAFMISELTSLGTVGAQIADESAIGGVGAIAGGIAPTDTDGDGMPDWWESAAATNPAVADHNGDLNGDGYTNLENYLNALAPAGIPAATLDGIADDTGVTSGDGVTSDTTLVLRGTSAPGRTIHLARADLGAIGTTVADASGSWTFDYSGTPLADRCYAFTAAANLGGTMSSSTRALIVKVDTTPAEPPVISGLVISPAYTFNGTAAPGDSVTVVLVGTGAVATATADGFGRWSAAYNGAPLAPGVYSFTASAIDLAGNAGGASAAYVVDTSLAPPAFTSIESDTGISTSDQITRDASLILHGTAPASSVVAITRAGFGAIGTATADGSGAWSFDYTGTTLASGDYTFTATASTGGTASPVSAPFAVTIDTVAPTINTITRFNPATPSTAASTLVFRVTFFELVVNVDVGDFVLTMSGSGVTGTLASLTPVSGNVYDVTVTGAGGDGTIRLDRRSGNSIQDLAGNSGSSGSFTGGQSYTMRLPGSSVWTSTEATGDWSDTANWEDNLVANGTGATADFATRDIDGDVTVRLDSPRTVGRVAFGDADQSSPGKWTLSDAGNTAHALTLAMPTGAPAIHVNYTGTTGQSNPDIAIAGSAYPAILDVAVNTAAGLTKTGWGTAILTKIGDFSGPISVSQGRLKLGPGATLNVPAISLAVSTQFEVAGGTFAVTGDANMVSGTGVGYIVSAGSASFQRIIPTNSRNNLVKVTGGMLTATELNFPRSADGANSYGFGLVIQGGETAIERVGLGTVNSWGAMSVEGGRIAIDELTVGWQQTANRGGQVRVLGGELVVNELVMSRKNGSNARNVAQLHLLGGVTTANRITLGYDSTVNDGSATINVNGGALYPGSGGIVRHGTGAFLTAINLIDGTLGARNDWSTDVPLTLADGNTIAIHAADAGNIPHAITLTGPLTGSGGFTKTGGGTLTLAGANTFTGSVALNEGTLRLTGSLAAGGTLTLNGGMLAGTGTIAKPVTWNAGGRLAFNLGANGITDQLVLGSALNKGTAGAHTIVFKPGAGFAAGNIYTLATFSSTDFAASDFTAVGLPTGYVASFNLTATTLQVTVKATALLALDDLRQAYDGAPKTPLALTTPGGLAVSFTYNGSTDAPTLPGTYAVVGTIVDAAYVGSASGTLVITTTALVRHAPSINGDVDGSVQLLLGESTSLNSQAGISGDLLVPGTPTVQLNGSPIYGGTQDATGGMLPSGYAITLNSNSLLRHVVRRVDPIAMPAVAAPQPPAGTQDVTLNTASQTIGNFATLRNLTLNPNAGARTIPPGAYGAFTANGGSGFVLGVAGATEPAVYHLQGLMLNNGATLQLAGPVILRVGSPVTINGGTSGSAANPGWLTFELAAGGLTLNGGATLHAEVLAPAGTVSINTSTTLRGRVSADSLTINASGLLDQAVP